jgi:hypothetical protein
MARWDIPEVIERDLLRPWAERVPIGLPHKREVEEVEYDSETGTAIIRVRITIPKDSVVLTLPVRLEADPLGGPPTLFRG